MAETFVKSPFGKAEKFISRATGFESILGGLAEDTAAFAKSDKRRIERQKKVFEAEQKQEQAESFKPKSAKAVQSRKAATATANRSESLLTRKA